MLILSKNMFYIGASLKIKLQNSNWEMELHLNIHMVLDNSSSMWMCRSVCALSFSLEKNRVILEFKFKLKSEGSESRPKHINIFK